VLTAVSWACSVINGNCNTVINNKCAPPRMRWLCLPVRSCMGRTLMHGACAVRPCCPSLLRARSAQELCMSTGACVKVVLNILVPPA